MNYDTNKLWIRQGDVLLRPLAARPVTTGSRITDGILARGEMTGHAHRLSVLTPELYDLDDGKMLLCVTEEGVSIQHEEHKPVEVPVGDYEVVIDREYDYIEDMARRVED